jgi:hypothetical protein
MTTWIVPRAQNARVIRVTDRSGIAKSAGVTDSIDWNAMAPEAPAMAAAAVAMAARAQDQVMSNELSQAITSMPRGARLTVMRDANGVLRWS